MANIQQTGFYVNDLSGFQIGLNLPSDTWDLLYNDAMEFNTNITNLINTIIIEFHETSNASIGARLLALENQLKQEYPSIYNKEVENGKSFVDIIKDKEKDKLLKLNLPKFYDPYYKLLKPKMMHKNIRINKEAANILDSSEESVYYIHGEGIQMIPGAGEYIAALMQDYVSRPRYKREQIYLNKNVERIRSAIVTADNSLINKKPHIIEFKLKQKIKDRNSSEVYQKTIILVPYELVHEKHNDYSYIIGIGKQILNNKISDKENILCIRLSNIDGLIKVKSALGYLSQKEIQDIEREKKEKGVQFLSGEVTEYTVRFTNKGLEHLKNWVYLRPKLLRVDENDKNIITFQGTDIQVRNYFLKFGNHAEILAPIEARKSIASVYYRGLSNYDDCLEELSVKFKKN